MTGERLAWHRVASHLGIPVTELATRLSHSEFLDWLEFLTWCERRTNKQDIYLAAIAAETRRSWVKDARKVTNADFLLKFESKEKLSGMSGKSAWLSALNVKEK